MIFLEEDYLYVQFLLAHRAFGIIKCFLSHHRQISAGSGGFLFQHDRNLPGRCCGVPLAIFHSRQRRVSQQVAGLNWAPFVLGLSVVGLEVGAIFMYKAGWEISVGNIVQAIFVAIALLVVGVLIYKEALTGTKVAGIAACLVGIFLLNK